MRMLQRAVATTVAGLAFSLAGLAGTAAASPEDGEGCVGTPAVPASYVCVISLTPTNALPTTTTTTIPVTVPPLCYFLDCTEETVVNVPVPGVQPSDGVVAVLWYRGQYIPISTGTGPVLTLIADTVDLAVETAAGVVQTVEDVIAGLPTTDELVQLVVDRVNRLIEDVQPTVDEVMERYRELRDQIDEIRDQVGEIVQREVDELIQRIGDLLGPISCNIDPVC